jgi:hypothetical protein
LKYLSRQAKPKNKKDSTFNTSKSNKNQTQSKRPIIILEVERQAYCRNKAMLTRLRAWKAKEAQERAQQKNLFFVVPFAFVGRELAPCGPFFVAF